MTYRLDELAKLASEQGLEGRRIDKDRLDVIVATDAVGELKDCWLAHKDEPLDLQYIEAGEELRVVRLSAREVPT